MIIFISYKIVIKWIAIDIINIRILLYFIFLLLQRLSLFVRLQPERECVIHSEKGTTIQEITYLSKKTIFDW